MKAFLYLLSGVLVAPGALLATYCWLIQTAVHDGNRFNNFWKTLVYVFFRLVETAVWAMYLLPPCLVVWVVLAFFPKYRIVGLSLTSLVAVASLIEFFLAGGWTEIAQFFIPVLSLAGLLLCGWMMWDIVRG